MSPTLTPLRVLESCLYAEDLAAAQEFYSRVLGLEPFLPASEREVFFRCGDGMVLIFDPNQTRVDLGAGSSVPIEGLTVPNHGAFGPGHLAFAVPPDEIDGWRARLGENNVEINSEIHWPNGAISLYFADPAGNCLELAVASLWQSKPWEKA